MSTKEIKKEIIQIAGELVGAELLSDESNLKENGLDSLSLVTVIAAIEDYFKISFDEDDLQPDKLLTLNNLVTLTEKYL